MRTVLCTLFNSLYLNKGLVLYDSLEEVSSNFVLYILCMDNECFDFFSNNDYKYIIPIRLEDIEDEEMLKAKRNRPFGEYCWTSTSALIMHVLKKYKEPICTYIDADMYFYKDPQILIDEMLASGCSVQMVPHRFSDKNKGKENIIGRYCVEFNTFKNDEKGMAVLMHWHNQCLDCCSNLGDGIHWGDQKYMDEWPEKPGVHVCENLGAGLATWNIDQYKMEGNSFNGNLIYKADNSILPLVFYHFASLTYWSRKLIGINIRGGEKNNDYRLIDAIYKPYLIKIEEKNVILEKKTGRVALRTRKGWIGYLKKRILSSGIYQTVSSLKMFDTFHLPLVYKL